LLNRRRAGQWVAEIVGRNKLLIERREICRPFFHAEVDHDGAILPDIVVIIGVIAVAMDEALTRSLIEMGVVYPIAFAKKATEDLDIEILQGGLSGQLMGTRWRGRERLDHGMPEIEGEFVFQEIVVIVGSDVDRNVPLLALHQQVEVEMILDFVRMARWLQNRL
jgi:hypothetical protein